MRIRNTSPLAVLMILALGASLSACGPTKSNMLQSTLFAYGKAVRWNEFDQATRFLAPEYSEDHPVTRLDAERYRQIRVTHYREYNLLVAPDGLSANQRVEIHFVNVHNKGQREIVDKQLWKFNPETNQWRLWSGLPDITRRSRR